MPITLKLLIDFATIMPKSMADADPDFDLGQYDFDEQFDAYISRAFSEQLAAWVNSLGGDGPEWRFHQEIEEFSNSTTALVPGPDGSIVNIELTNSAVVDQFIAILKEHKITVTVVS